MGQASNQTYVPLSGVENEEVRSLSSLILLKVSAHLAQRALGTG